MAPRGLEKKEPTKLFVFDTTKGVLHGVWVVSPDGAVEQSKEIPPIPEGSFLSSVLPRAGELRLIGGVAIYLNKMETDRVYHASLWYRGHVGRSRGGRSARTRTRLTLGSHAPDAAARERSFISSAVEREVIAQSQAEAESAAEAQQIEEESVRRVMAESLREDGDDAVSELRKALVERLQRRVEGATAEACNDALDDCGDEEDEAVFVLLFQAASTPGSDEDGELSEEEFLRRLDAATAASEEAAAAEEELAAQEEEQLRAAMEASEAPERQEQALLADVIQDSMAAEEARAKALADAAEEEEKQLRLVKQASIEAAEMVDEDEQTKQATYESIRDRLATSQVRDAAIEQLLNTGATREACGKRLDECDGNVDEAALLLLTDVAEAAPTKAATERRRRRRRSPTRSCRKRWRRRGWKRDAPGRLQAKTTGQQ